MTEPAWLVIWISVLIIVNLSAIFFIMDRHDGQWQVRGRPIAILAGFIISAAFMNWLYAQYGYVRLLGAAHFIGWLPAFIYVYSGLKQISGERIYGKYLRLYLLIAGVCLAIDAIDVVRHLAGDGELFMRWG